MNVLLMPCLLPVLAAFGVPVQGAESSPVVEAPAAGAPAVAAPGTPTPAAAVSGTPTPTAAVAPGPAPSATAGGVAGAARPDPFPARRTDAAMDQAWLAPTALTQPAGSVTLQNHELAVLGATFAPFERWQISATGVPAPIAPGVQAMVSTKLRVLDVSRLHLALLAGGGVVLRGDFAYGGAVASVCLDADCASVVSAHGLMGPHRQKTEMMGLYHSTATVFGASAIVALAHSLKAIAELNVLGHQHRVAHHTDDAAEVLFGFIGMRFHRGRFAGNLGVAIWAESSLYYVSQPAVATTPMERRWKSWAYPGGSLSVRFGGS